MKPSRTYVNQKSDLTNFKNVLDALKVLNVRTRSECECQPGQNQRDAILAVAEGGCAATFIIRCKGCVARKASNALKCALADLQQVKKGGRP